MQYTQVMDALRSYDVPVGQPPTIFLLPEPGMRAIYDCITTNRLTDALELGSWRGATSCVMAAAAQEIGGTVTSVDILLQQPANAPHWRRTPASARSSNSSSTPSVTTGTWLI